MLVKNTIIALMAVAPVLSIPVPPTTKAAGTVATTKATPAKPSAGNVSKDAVLASEKTVDRENASGKSTTPKTPTTQLSTKAAKTSTKLAAGGRYASKEAADRAKNPVDTLHNSTRPRHQKTNALTAGGEHRSPRNKHGLQIDTTGHHHRHSSHGVATPGTGRSSKHGATPRTGHSAKHSATTPRTGRSAKHSATTPRTGHSVKHSATTPGTGRSAKHSATTPRTGHSVKHSATTPGTGRSAKHSATTPRTGHSVKHSATTPRTGLSAKHSATTPRTGLSAKHSAATTPRTGHSNKSATPGFPQTPFSSLSTGFTGGYSSPGFSPPANGMTEEIAWTPTTGGGYKESISWKRPSSTGQLRRRALPATPPPASPAIRNHKSRKSTSVHKHSVAEVMQLSQMLIEAEKVVNGLEEQMNKPTTVFSNLKRHSKHAAHKTPTTPPATPPAAKTT